MELYAHTEKRIPTSRWPKRLKSTELFRIVCKGISSKVSLGWCCILISHISHTVRAQRTCRRFWTLQQEKCWHIIYLTCLLYTSDAADEEDSVDLGGRRIIKKKK